jgi:hypothetical protein
MTTEARDVSPKDKETNPKRLMIVLFPSAILLNIFPCSDKTRRQVDHASRRLGGFGDSDADAQGSLTSPGAKPTVGMQSAYPKQKKKKTDFFGESLGHAACISEKCRGCKMA